MRMLDARSSPARPRARLPDSPDWIIRLNPRSYIFMRPEMVQGKVCRCVRLSALSGRMRSCLRCWSQRGAPRG